jgi:sulfate adenylyltransferase subunit 1 (EFTu-like GTPase family)
VKTTGDAGSSGAGSANASQVFNDVDGHLSPPAQHRASSAAPLLNISAVVSAVECMSLLDWGQSLIDYLAQDFPRLFINDIGWAAAV